MIRSIDPLPIQNSLPSILFSSNNNDVSENFQNNSNDPSSDGGFVIPDGYAAIPVAIWSGHHQEENKNIVAGQQAFKIIHMPSLTNHSSSTSSSSGMVDGEYAFLADGGNNSTISAQSGGGATIGVNQVTITYLNGQEQKVVRYGDPVERDETVFIARQIIANPPPQLHSSVNQTRELVTLTASGKPKRVRKTFVCDEPGCGKTYKSSTHFKSHIRMHKGMEPYACDFPECDKKFALEHDLRRHSLKHGERNFVCSLCEKSFYRKDHARNHIRLHLRPAEDNEGEPIIVVKSPSPNEQIDQYMEFNS